VEAVLTSPCPPLLCASRRRRRRRKKNIGRRQAVMATVTDVNDKEEDNNHNYRGSTGKNVSFSNILWTNSEYPYLLKNMFIWSL
jgi:hypothetical protein